MALRLAAAMQPAAAAGSQARRSAARARLRVLPCGRPQRRQSDKDAPAFRTLGQRYPVESLEEALGEGFMSGHPDMPEFKFDADDVGAIIAYLKSIQQR